MKIVRQSVANLFDVQNRPASRFVPKTDIVVVPAMVESGL
jgi:hypothetical protein